MNAIRARLAAAAASFLLASAGAAGVQEFSPEMTNRLTGWLEHTFELVLFVGYAVLHPLLQKRSNPTGAMSDAAARDLERVLTPAQRTTP